ncbi:hypothetical protein D9M68_718460 [compost metagenome]
MMRRRKNRSRRNRPCWTICSRLQLVALMMRRLTLRSFTEPMRRMLRSSSSLSSLAWSTRSISPTSSRNRVPPSAASTRPTRRSLASVKAPFSWPNSSDSSRCDGIAAQLNSTKGPLLRLPSKCSARAISSLPVPVSPSISTAGSSASAMWLSASSRWRTMDLTSSIAGDSPSSAPRPESWAARLW